LINDHYSVLKHQNMLQDAEYDCNIQTRKLPLKRFPMKKLKLRINMKCHSDEKTEQNEIIKYT